jgi:2,4-diaminopentanoate dehydrogenase
METVPCRVHPSFPVPTYPMLTVAIIGAGQLGSGIAQILRGRGIYRLLGPCDRAERQKGLSSGADVVVIATTTRLRDVATDIEAAIRAGSNVLVSAEECAYPFAVDASLAQRLDRLAVDQGVSIAGCGLNPGLIFDSLVLTLLGAAPDDCRIEVRRTVDISRFGTTVLRRIGIGRSAEAFADGVARGEILGHAGFPQSMWVVAAAMGRSIDQISTELLPVITSTSIDLADRFRIQSGESAGVDQTYIGIVNGQRWFTCHFFGHVDLQGIGASASDSIELRHGDKLLHTMSISPGMPSQSGSQYMLANSVARIVDARPGWRTVAELVPAHPSVARS